MRKISNNNKFRANTVYSLNYKFDSVSVAGKFSGTALDLIKKYNELAKEAHSNGNYVEMEVFRQYAEHYRKIVTEINERKNQQRDNQNEQNAENNGNSENGSNSNTAEAIDEAKERENNSEANEKDNSCVVEEKINNQEVEANKPENVSEDISSKTEEQPRRRRSFTIVDVSQKEKAKSAEVGTDNKPKTRRSTRTKVAKDTEVTE